MENNINDIWQEDAAELEELKKEVLDETEITITTVDGTDKKATVLLHFALEPEKKEFIIYTFGEVDENGLETIYAAATEVDETGNDVLTGVTDDEEWMRIKEVLRTVIKKSREE